MKHFFTFLLVLFIANVFSKEKYNDTIQSQLHGHGCGIFPTDKEIDYNIQLLNKYKALDTNNVYVYKHLASEYFILFSREKDSVRKIEYQQLAIVNNLKVIELKQFKRYILVNHISNIILLYGIIGDCNRAKYYYSTLSKKEKKSISDTGVDLMFKKKCGNK